MPSKKTNQVYHFSLIYRVKDESDIHKWIEEHLRIHGADKYVFQLEKGDKKGKYHYQVYCHRLKRTRACTWSKTLNYLVEDWPETLVNIGCEHASKAGIAALSAYCMKEDTRVNGPWSDRPIYRGRDMVCMQNPSPWQKEVIDAIAAEPNDRTINWVYNPSGSVGKTKLFKWLCFNKKAVRVCQGTATQIKTAVIALGSHRAYLVDLPRCSGREESIRDLFSALESIKAGWVCSAMYGKPQELFMQPPHVWIVSNDLPNLSLASADMWKVWKVESLQSKLISVSTLGSNSAIAPNFIPAQG